jgi:phosphatidylglycerol:prolipoprotein diacylglycerol transferase
VFAAIPFFEIPLGHIQLPGYGPLPVDPWATLVCTGFVLGLELARARAIKLGLDVRDIVDGAVFTVGMGFLVGHIFTVVAYYPERMFVDGHFSFYQALMANLRVWEGFASFGGFLGAVIGSTLFYFVIRKRAFFRHADVITYGFPFGWIFGRLGCGVVHDHVGKLTTFPLAMDFDHGFAIDTWKFWTWHLASGDPAPDISGIRHELGLYEAVFMMGIAAIWLALGRKDRVPGFFLGLFAILYAPVRFGFEFLRNSDLQHQDARYLGLTPAQYGAVVMLGLGVAILATRDWKGFVAVPLGVQPPPPPPAEAGAPTP